jgi:hypothetical protein
MRIVYLKVVGLLFTFFITLSSVNAQGIELGLFLGASNYCGDLSNDAIMISQTHPSAAIIGRYNLSEKWAVKGFVAYGRISGTDEEANTDIKKMRNLSFYSDLFEVSAQVEFNLVRNSYRYTSTRKLIPYLFTGVGIFNFNPKTDLNGTEYELQPLGTEGQGTTTYNDRTKYALTQICIPFGIGFKKKISQHMSFGLEIGARYTFTNYLDDIGGVYADPRVVGRASGVPPADGSLPPAQLLSDRSWELTPDQTVVFHDGDKRSMKKIDINDMYIMGGITFTYIFSNSGIKCPRF